MRFLISIFSIIFCVTYCTNINSQPNFDGAWSLVTSNDLADEYYQLKIEGKYIDRLFSHGILRDSSTFAKGEALLSGHRVVFELLAEDKLKISDDETTHLFKKIDKDCYCFCTDADFQFWKFNYTINQTPAADTLKIRALKNEIWDYFQGDVIFENELEDLIILDKKN